MGKLKLLTNFTPCNNQLTSIPSAIQELKLLTSLDFSNNAIQEAPPEVGELPLLTRLDLSGNQLTDISPNLGRLSKLQSLVLSDNPTLRELPLNLGELSHLTYLSCEDTKVPRQLREAIVEACQILRENPNFTPLEDRLRTWYAAAGRTQENLHLENFDASEQATVNEWLGRLEISRDFKGNQAVLTSTACEILETATTKPSFKENFLVQVRANNVRCQDRAAMAMNELYTSWKITNLPEGAGEQEKLKILAQGAKTATLRSELANTLREKRIQIGPKMKESTEIYLFYESRLREYLDLLSLTQDMSFGVLVKEEWGIDDYALISAVEEKYLDYLVSLPACEEVLSQNKDFQSRWEPEDEAFQDRMANLPTDGMNEQQITTTMNALMTEREGKKEQMMKEWFLAHHPS